MTQLQPASARVKPPSNVRTLLSLFDSSRENVGNSRTKASSLSRNARLYSAATGDSGLRGCSFGCDFCAAPLSNAVYTRKTPPTISFHVPAKSQQFEHPRVPASVMMEVYMQDGLSHSSTIP